MSVQLENGYTKIANELLEAMAKCNCFGFANGQIVWAIIRKTYGWNKKSDYISITQIMEATGLSRRTVIYSIQDLEAKNIIIVKRERIGSLNKTNHILFNKRYSEWVVQNYSQQTEKNRQRAKIRSAKLRYGTGGSAKLGQKVVRSFAPTKETDKRNNTDSLKSSSEKTMIKQDSRKFDTDYEDVVTEEGEKVGVNLKEKPNVAKAMRSLLKWGEEQRGGKFTNYLKQFKAMKNMRVAGISVEDIKARWSEMENDKFYTNNGFDFTTVAGSFDRKR